MDSGNLQDEELKKEDKFWVLCFPLNKRMDNILIYVSYFHEKMQIMNHG